MKIWLVRSFSYAYLRDYRNEYAVPDFTGDLGCLLAGVHYKFMVSERF